MIFLCLEGVTHRYYPVHDPFFDLIAIGANFSYFTMSEDTVAFTDEGLVLAGMVAQIEFPIITVPDMSMFNTYSFYTEGQLWFISSDVEAGVAGRISFGLRANVF